VAKLVAVATPALWLAVAVQLHTNTPRGLHTSSSLTGDGSGCVGHGRSCQAHGNFTVIGVCRRQRQRGESARVQRSHDKQQAVFTT
jgi:hypothetical protein